MGERYTTFSPFPSATITDYIYQNQKNLKLLTLQQQAQHLTLALLIIDEISNVGPEMLAQIELRIRQIMENDLPFGGIAQLYLGYFFQIPPVSPAETLYHDVCSTCRLKT
jgi:hypothetical protein